MSSFVPIGNPSDMGSFEAALEMLGSMSGNGNLAASEFLQNLEQVKVCLDTFRERNGRGAETGNAAAAIGPGNLPALPPGPMMGPAENDIHIPATAAANTALNVRDSAEGFTTAMAFLEPTMQDFLAQSDFDLGLLHPVDTFMNEPESLYNFNGL